MGDLPSEFDLPDHPAADVPCFAMPVPSAEEDLRANKFKGLVR
jgi:hypothetical protein